MDIISWIKTTLSKYSSNNTHDKNAIYFVKNEDGKTGKIISDEVVYGNGDDANGVVVESPNQPTEGESVWVNPDEDPEEVAVYNRSQVDALHQSIVNSITSLSEAGYLFSGVATSETNPGTPDAKVFYIANGKGIYEKFGGLEVTEDDVVVLYWDSAWHKVATGIASQEKLSELEKELTIIGEGFDWKVGYIANNGQLVIPDDNPKTYICLEPKIYTEDKSYTIPDGMILVVKKGSSPTSLSVVAEGSSSNFAMNIKNDGKYTSYTLRHSDLSDISPSEGINAASRKKRLDDIDNRLGDLNAELNDLKSISTYQEEYVLDNAVSQLTDASVSSKGTIESYPSYSIKLYKLEANKKYLLRRKVEWSGIYLGYVAEFDIDNFVVGGSATSVILGSTSISEQEVSYGIDTYISILSKNDRGTFYEIVGFNDKGVADVKQNLDSIETELQSIEKVVRKSIVIKRTDDNIQLYDKLLLAYSEGNTDVYFETGTYILNEVYSYMKNTLGYTSMYEMQIGNGCRYYLGGATLISKHVDGIVDNDRSVFGTRMNSSDYELHDGILITDGGHYCVHDDTQIYNKQYKHGYYNMAFFCTNDDNVRVPEAPLGCGVGKYVTTIFENCVFDSVSDTSFFVHGIINDTNHIVVNYKLTFSNCWFGKSVGISSYLTNEDDITLTLTNCSFKWAMSGTEKCKRVFEWGNEVRKVE